MRRWVGRWVGGWRAKHRHRAGWPVRLPDVQCGGQICTMGIKLAVFITACALLGVQGPRSHPSCLPHALVMDAVCGLLV